MRSRIESGMTVARRGLDKAGPADNPQSGTVEIPASAGMAGLGWVSTGSTNDDQTTDR